MKAIIIVAFLALVAIVCADRNEFAKFKKHHGKKYRDNDHEERRYAHFKHAHDKIEKHNSEKHSYTMGHNEFSDMSEEEFRKMHLTELKIVTPRALPAATQPSIKSFPLGPEAISYINYTLPVRYQGGCASCWAFATSAQVETVLKRRDPKFSKRLSPQYLLDCAPNNGCRGGGSADLSLEYMTVNGFVADTNYPYVTANGTCNTTIPKMTQKINGHFYYMLYNNEQQLANLIASVGPVVTTMETKNSFKYYKTGVYSDPTCDNTCDSINHLMLIVGYGYDAALGKKYWLIKNSWGTSWGEGGYFRLIRADATLNNNCNVACYIDYAY